MTKNPKSGFFESRWRGEANPRVLLWRDAIYIGTLINLAAGFTGMMMLIQGVAPLWALAVHLAPVPYNGFLLLSVWRSKQCTPTASTIATVWFVVMLII